MIDGLDRRSITNIIINKMKTRITIMLLALFVSFNIGFAQQDEECMNNLSIFDSYVKSKKYDDAYGPWKIVRNKCPKFNRAIYAHGEKILLHKIKNASGADQVAHINDLMSLYDKSVSGGIKFYKEHRGFYMAL